MPMKHAVTLAVTRYFRDVNHRAMGTRHLVGTTEIRLKNHMGTQSVARYCISREETNRGMRKTEGLHDSTQQCLL